MFVRYICNSYKMLPVTRTVLVVVCYVKKNTYSFCIVEVCVIHLKQTVYQAIIDKTPIHALFIQHCISLAC